MILFVISLFSHNLWPAPEVLGEIFFFFLSFHLWCEQYSFGFSRFKPWGASVRSVWVHLNSTLWWMVIACGLLGVFLMNSKIVIWTSSVDLHNFDNRCTCIIFFVVLFKIYFIRMFLLFGTFDWFPFLWWKSISWNL